MTYNIPLNATSLDAAYVGISTAMPELFPLLLFFEFMVIMVAGAFAQSRKTGFSNIPLWGLIAGLTTTMTAFYLFLIPGLIGLDVLVLTFIATLIFGVISFFTSQDSIF